jgi:hypothetical protein
VTGGFGSARAPHVNGSTAGAMRCLSIRQPWAWAILHAGKRLENRLAWHGCAYRGPVLLHASSWPVGELGRLCSKPSVPFEEFLAEKEAMLAAWPAEDKRRYPEPVTLRGLLEHRGGIVGVCRITGEIKPGPRYTKALLPSDHPQKSWHAGGFALVLDDVAPLPFTPCKGSLGLWEYTPSGEPLTTAIARWMATLP